MPQLTPQQLRDFARLGAEARLAQLDAEIAAIRSTYPELARARGPARAQSRQATTRAARRRRYRMSPEARKAAAERMRKYWAERKAGQPASAAQPKRRSKRSASRRTRAKK